MITLVKDTGGDWTDLYKDGKLIDGNHRLDERIILDATGVEYEVKWMDYYAHDEMGRVTDLSDIEGLLED